MTGNSKPALVAYGFAILFIVACQVPTEYTKEVGQALRITTSADPEALVRFVQEQAGDLLTDVSISLQMRNDGTQIGEALFSFEGGDIDLNALQKDLEQFREVEATAIEPITHEFRSNLVAAALHKSVNLQRIINIDLNITDLTAAEIEQAVKDQFAAEGLDAKVSVAVSRDSSRSRVAIKTELADSINAEDLPGIILNLQDDNVDGYDQQLEDIQVIQNREAGTRTVIRGSEAGTQSAP